MGRLNYLTVTRPDITFAVSVVSQFLNAPCDSHWDAVMRILRYFLGIEVAQSSSGIAIFQRMFALDILTETGMLDCRPSDTPMDPNVKLLLG